MIGSRFTDHACTLTPCGRQPAKGEHIYMAATVFSGVDYSGVTVAALREALHA